MSNQPNQVNEFISSKSMTTPGIAGATVMFITNALDLGFSCGPYVPHIVLGFSFLAGIVVFFDPSTGVKGKIALYVINSFLIYAMAIGTNTLGTKATGKTTSTENVIPGDEIQEVIKPIGFYRGYGEEPFSIVLAQQPQTPQNPETEKALKLLKSLVTNTSARIQLVQKELVDNQVIYNDPKAKMDALIRINSELVLVSDFLKSDSTLKKEAIYQESLLTIQQNIDIFERALTIEKSNKFQIQERRTFFKPWFKEG